MCLRTFLIIRGRANVFRGPSKRSGSQEFGEVCMDNKETLRTRRSKTSRRVKTPGCDFASSGLPCPRSLLVMTNWWWEYWQSLPLTRCRGDLSFLDDQTAPKSCCLKMTEARSQRGYHSNASSNNPQKREETGGMTELKHGIPSGLERHGRLNNGRAADMLELSSPQMYTFLHTSRCSKGHVWLQPREKAFASLCTRHDWLIHPGGWVAAQTLKKIVSEILKVESPH